MDWPLRLVLTSFQLAAAAIRGTHADAMVTGTVFCGRCKDGQISLFDYPLYGTVMGKSQCREKRLQIGLENYAMRFEGTPDLSGCYGQVSGAGQSQSNDCGAVAGPARNARLMFQMLGMEMYSVDPLLSQPAHPMSFCPRSTSLSPPPIIHPTPPPPVKSPPLPLPPISPLPPMPFLEASACPYWNWTMPEYRCYWNVVNPDAKVAVVFGLISARRYGTDMTLWEGMQGRGDPYRTLLREGTTALLNSYSSMQFPYHPLAVILDMNWAIMEPSTRQVLRTALRFKRVNSRNGKVSCRVTACNS